MRTLCSGLVMMRKQSGSVDQWDLAIFVPCASLIAFAASNCVVTSGCRVC